MDMDAHPALSNQEQEDCSVEKPRADSGAVAAAAPEPNLKDGCAHLKVRVVSAADLPNVDHWLAGVSDPYVVCKVQRRKGCQFKTNVVDNDLNPVWEHEADVKNVRPDDTLVFSVWDSNMFLPDRILGKVELTAHELLPSGLPLSDLPLSGSDASGTLRLGVQVTATSVWPQALLPQTPSASTVKHLSSANLEHHNATFEGDAVKDGQGDEARAATAASMPLLPAPVPASGLAAAQVGRRDIQMMRRALVFLLVLVLLLAVAVFFALRRAGDAEAALADAQQLCAAAAAQPAQPQPSFMSWWR